MYIQRLNEQHDRTAFDCGEASLNDYLRRYARQNAERGIGLTYIAVNDTTPTHIAGYYTLSGSALARATMPEEVRLPRYPVPTALIGRLAVDRQSQGQGVGALLLIDALNRVGRLADEMGIYAVEVQALHERARAFYEYYGFIPLLDDPLHLYLPLQTARQAGLLGA